MTEESKDPFEAILKPIRKDPKFQALREALVLNYVYMSCFSNDPLQMAYNEGMREMAAMICGTNVEIHEWLERTTTTG